MANIDDYTVLEIIKKYEKIIGADTEELLLSIFPEKEKKCIKEIANTEIQKIGLDKNDRRIRMLAICNIIADNPDMNDDNEWKLNILSNVYRKFSQTMNPKELAELKKLILGEKKFAVLKFNIDKNSGISDYEIITSENRRKLSSIKSDRTRTLIEHSFEIADIEDLKSIIDSKFSNGMFAIIMNKMANQFFLEQKRLPLEEFKKLLEDGNFEKLVDECEDEFKNTTINYLKDNLQYIDVTDLLLNSAARVMLGIKLGKKEQIRGIRLNENNSGKLEISIEYLRQLYKELQKREYKDTSYGIFLEDGSEVMHADKESIREFLGRCTRDDYVSDKDIESIHEQILNGVLVEDIQKRKIANINVQDLINASKSYDAKTDDNDKTRILQCAIELTEYLKDNEDITDENILNMYLEGKLNLELTRNIDMSEFSEEYYNEKFKLLYEEMLYSTEWSEQSKGIRDLQTEEAKKLSRFSMLYKHLIEDKKVDVESLIEKLISANGEDYGLGIMDDLYDLDLVTIEKCIDWIGPSILFKQCEKGTLPPTKVRELYQIGTIDLDIIASIVNKSPNITQKFMLIGSIFPEESEEDKNNRSYLIGECLTIDSEIVNNGEAEARSEEKGEKNRYQKHITDPFDRMSLISALDKDYYFEMTLDGHVIAHLPNFQKVMIEKMFDKNGEPSYGVATYILDEEYYNRNKNRIIKGDRVCRQEMFKDRELKEVSRIIHFVDTWGKDIKAHFGIEEGSRWSEKDLMKIEEAIERIKRNQIIIGEN